MGELKIREKMHKRGHDGLKGLRMLILSCAIDHPWCCCILSIFYPSMPLCSELVQFYRFFCDGL